MGQQKGGKKLRRTTRHKGMYERQFYRTASNKIRRLRKRLGWDPLAGQQIKTIELAKKGQ